MPIRIITHHLELSPALYDFAQAKLSKAPRIANDALGAVVVLRRHHGTSEGRRFSASARLALAGRDLHAKASHSNLYSAILKLVALLVRRSRKRKTRLAKARFQRGSRPVPASDKRSPDVCLQTNLPASE